MNKNELRIKYKEIRRLISNKKEQSRIICQKIIDSDLFKMSDVVACYYPLEDEVDIKDIIEKALKMNKIILLPKVINKQEMEFRQIFSLDDLTLGKMNIKEPKDGKVYSLDDIDLMLVPGIVFDLNENRIGYGGGYYDRYLQKKNKTITVGISFKEQLSKESLDIDKNDIKMDFIIST